MLPRQFAHATGRLTTDVFKRVVKERFGFHIHDPAFSKHSTDATRGQQSSRHVLRKVEVLAADRRVTLGDEVKLCFYFPARGRKNFSNLDEFFHDETCLLSNFPNSSLPGRFVGVQPATRNLPHTPVHGRPPLFEEHDVGGSAFSDNWGHNDPVLVGNQRKVPELPPMWECNVRFSEADVPVLISDRHTIPNPTPRASPDGKRSWSQRPEAGDGLCPCRTRLGS